MYNEIACYEIKNEGTDLLNEGSLTMRYYSAKIVFISFKQPSIKYFPRLKFF